MLSLLCRRQITSAIIRYTSTAANKIQRSKWLVVIRDSECNKYALHWLYIMFQCFISNCYHTKIYIKNYPLSGTLHSTKRTLSLVKWCCHLRSLHNYQAGIRDGKKLRCTKVDWPHNNIRYNHSIILLVKTLTQYMSVPSFMKISVDSKGITYPHACKKKRQIHETIKPYSVTN